jgi:uncharacterized oxidoreductase
MKIEGNTILITGGATGIGFALAEAFVKSNEVIICGRREDKLKDAKRKIPELNTIKCDISKELWREMLYKEVKSNFKDINILVNNAGIQRNVDFKKGIADLLDEEDEISTNLIAPIYLTSYFIPDFLKKESAIINVSSGLAFVPLTFMPIYCATKAALHSYSLSLRHQLKDTSVKVFELIPPMVDTDLSKGRREERAMKDRGIQPNLVVYETLEALEKDEYEITIGTSKNLRMADMNNFEQIFQGMNNRE